MNGIAKNRTSSGKRRAERGIMLIDCLVYCVLFFAVTGVAFSFFYTCWDGSLALRRNSDDITNALRAGETWRADVRAATGAIQVQDSADGEVVRIPEKSGEVVYRFASGTFSRRAGGQDWRVLLPNVGRSRMQTDSRPQVTAWRWELELMTMKKRTLKLHPAFTFEAVPGAVIKP
jgi:hypothetical protein